MTGADAGEHAAAATGERACLLLPDPVQTQNVAVRPLCASVGVLNGQRVWMSENIRAQAGKSSEWRGQDGAEALKNQ